MKFWDECLTKIGWPFARLFVAGDTMQDAFRVAADLNNQGFETIINFLGEEVKDRTQAWDNVNVYAAVIREIYHQKLRARISVKPSQLGLKIDPEFYRQQLRWIGRDAFAHAVPLEIDIETEDTLTETIANTIALAKYYPGLDLRQAVAMNFKDIFDHIFDLTKAGIKIRLCKGAYKGSVFGKNEVKGRYRSAFSFLLRNQINPACATHDLDLVKYALSLKNEYPFSCEFQFLLGLRKKTWKKLIDRGERVAIYVPFGTHWLPYAKRRWIYILKKLPAIISGN